VRGGGGDQWCCQDLVSGGQDYRDAKGAEWVGYGEECPLPSRLGGLGERRELPQRVRGGVPAAIAFSAYFRPQNVVVTVTTIFKSGGDKPPSSHTKLRLCLSPCKVSVMKIKGKGTGRGHTRNTAPLSEETSLQKLSGMARFVEEVHRFTNAFRPMYE